jgi:alpha-beta hydrolase superfamily lysophospholipase
MVRTHDGPALHGRDWPCRAARGTVLVVHGLGEHIGRYAQVAAELNARGWRVVGYDQRGHGASEGGRGHQAVAMTC